ncbi:MAG: methyltransferase domain-containing protein [Acidobacteria bacterium]|nr:MAG: methyltransferase domain-containing protein [Acidobacteriota bacterium]
MAQWDPNLYLRFGDERTQPAIDLAVRVALEAPRRVIDIGCGPGNSTAVLRRRWPLAQIIGLDSSAEMIERARRDAPGQQWICADAASFNGEQGYDLVYSNATLQWIPDHRDLVLRLWDAVASGGALAVQVPANQQSPLHRALLAVAEREPFRKYLDGARSLFTYHPAGFYYDLLAPIARRYETWTTEYLHVMKSHDDLMTWYRGTGMRPFLQALEDDGQRQAFESAVLSEARHGYPVQSDGKLLFPFRRLFFVAYRRDQL